MDEVKVHENTFTTNVGDFEIVFNPGNSVPVDLNNDRTTQNSSGNCMAILRTKILR